MALSMEMKSSLGLTGSNIGPFEGISALWCCGIGISSTLASWWSDPVDVAVVVSVASFPGRVTKAFDSERVRGVNSESVSVSRTDWWLT